MVTHKLRFIYVSFIITIMSLAFWSFSRYPDLNQKKAMASHATIADTIAMWPILEVKATDPLWQQIGYTTVNWAHDNRKGMTFGVLLGALFLTLFGYLRIEPGRSQWLRTFQGFLLGTPLGVCVNCAAPVFKGVLSSREKELAFAMMLSSPTMNFIVVMMTFTLFPLYMAVTKVSFTLFMIFAAIPLISKILGPNHPLNDFDSIKSQWSPFCDIKEPINESLFKAITAASREFLQNLWQLSKATLPLMLIAGFLGSAVSHLVPIEKMVGHSGVLITLLTAAVGLFLPVPMAFDVILTNALYQAGLSPALSLVLLCTLGIFSAYSFMITWRCASKQWALSLSGIALSLAVILGELGPWLHATFYVQPNIRDFQAFHEIQKPHRAEPVSKPVVAAKNPIKLERELVFENAELRIWKYPFFAKKTASGRFLKKEGPEIGLDRGFTYGIRDYPDPFWIGRGTASGDYKKTGWPGVVFGSDEGVFLYENIGGHFIPDLSLPEELKRFRVYAVAFVDWGGSGNLDLFVTTFNHGNFLIRNEGGRFSQTLEKIPNGGGILTIAPAIGAFGVDGSLGIFNGNMALGVISAFQRFGEGRRNSLSFFKQNSREIQEIFLDELDGETMASLASDFNGDGFIDLYANNDFIVADQLWFGKGPLAFNKPAEEMIKKLETPYFSMSIDTGDLNNDLIMDFVSTGTIEPAPWVGKEAIDGKSKEEYQKLDGEIKDCYQIKDEFYRNNCIVNRKTDHLIPFYENRSLNIKDCKKLTDPVAFDDCLLSIMWMIVTSHVSVKSCSEEFGFDEQIKEVCEIFVRIKSPYSKSDFDDALPQVDRGLVWLGTKEGDFKKADFKHPGGWTWSTKMADFDNDGWQDIFNAEGAIRKGEFGFNALLHNQKGEGFLQKQFSWNLSDPMPLYSFTLIDFNHDGRLDIIGNSSLGPVQVYENDLDTGHGTAIAIQNQTLNTHGINYKILLEDNEGKKQIREIKAGGGYQSFDDYRAWFGLGSADRIREITVIAPGKTIKTSVDLPSEAFYLIESKS